MHVYVLFSSFRLQNLKVLTPLRVLTCSVLQPRMQFGWITKEKNKSALNALVLHEEVLFIKLLSYIGLVSVLHCIRELYFKA